MGRTDGERVAIAADGQCVAHVSGKRPAAAEMVRLFTVRRLEIGELPQPCHRSLGRYWDGRPVRHAGEDREADQAREEPDTHDHNGILVLVNTVRQKSLIPLWTCQATEIHATIHRSMRCPIPILTLTFLVVFADTGRAQSDLAAIRATRQIEALRIHDAIVINGQLDEPAW